MIGRNPPVVNETAPDHDEDILIPSAVSHLTPGSYLRGVSKLFGEPESTSFVVAAAWD